MKKGRSTEAAGPSLRLLRVGENIRHAISTILQRRDIQDDALTGVSITVSEVRCSPDLRHATIFIMPLGGGDQKSILKALNGAAPYIRGQLGKMVHMKYLPKPAFRIDESYGEASHIENILRSEKVQQDLQNSESDADGGGVDSST